MQTRPRITLMFDGACEDNGSDRATATYGWVARDQSNHRVIESGRGVVTDKPTTNNAAEWRALIEGLKWVAAQPVRPERLLVKGDSQLVINQLTGKYSCRQQHLSVLRDEAISLLAQLLVPWRAEWVPREQNEHADALAGGRRRW